MSPRPLAIVAFGTQPSRAGADPRPLGSAMPEGARERSPSPKPSPRLYSNAACRSTVALTAQVNRNSPPPVPTAGRRLSYPRASAVTPSSKVARTCFLGPRLVPARDRIGRTADPGRQVCATLPRPTPRTSPAKDALLAHRHGPDTRTLPYMHNNPAKRGLVNSPGDRPWSSWRLYFLHDASVLRMDRPD
jgi:hypothetical protein